MTPEQQRIAIAEACGWQIHPKDRFIVIPPNSPHSVQPLSTIPDYLNDLNAMHEAEKVLTEDQFGFYENELYDMLEDSRAISASAAQRAEAFIKTLNLEPK